MPKSHPAQKLVTHLAGARSSRKQQLDQAKKSMAGELTQLLQDLLRLAKDPQATTEALGNNRKCKPKAEEDRSLILS